MKRNVYMVMDKYGADGWNLLLVDPTDEWLNERYGNMDTAIMLEWNLFIRDPDTSELVAAGMNKAAEMQEDAQKEYMRSKVAVKEYEARFMMLHAQEEISEEG